MNIMCYMILVYSLFTNLKVQFNKFNHKVTDRVFHKSYYYECGLIA